MSDKRNHRPFWLPEGARRTTHKGEQHRNRVSYLAPNGQIRQYVAAEWESREYRMEFEGSTDTD